MQLPILRTISKEKESSKLSSNSRDLNSNIRPNKGPNGTSILQPKKHGIFLKKNQEMDEYLKRFSISSNHQPV